MVLYRISMHARVAVHKLSIWPAWLLEGGLNFRGMLPGQVITLKLGLRIALYHRVILTAFTVLSLEGKRPCALSTVKTATI